MKRITYTQILLIFLLLLSEFLYSYRLSQTMLFIGDAGWFYLDARDLLLGKTFPLVGITSSHPWIHQGAYWTYLLALALKLGNFNPLAGGYLASMIGVATVFTMYWVGKKMFSEKVGLLSACLYATSPLVITYMRTPYHTTPLPLLALLFLLFLYEWVEGKKYAFIALCAVVALLYNFELASVMFLLPFFLVVMYGYKNRTTYFLTIKNIRTISSAFVVTMLIMLPMLIYDVHHGFPQTLRFLVWLVYRALVTIGILKLGAATPHVSWQTFFDFISTNASYLYYFLPSVLSLGIGHLTIIGMGVIAWIKKTPATILLTVTFLSTFLVFFTYRTPSDAYLFLFFPYFLLSLSVLISFIHLHWVRRAAFLLIILLALPAPLILIQQDFQLRLQAPYTYPYAQRLDVAKTVMQKAGKSRYTIVGKDMIVPSVSNTMNYEYILWYLGHPVVDSFPGKVITIQEEPRRISIGEK